MVAFHGSRRLRSRLRGPRGKNTELDLASQMARAIRERCVHDNARHRSPPRMRVKNMSPGPVVHTIDLITGDLVEHLVKAILRAIGVDLHIPRSEKRSVDERIARLDDAKAALTESLEAIDELRADAEAARTEHAAVVQALDTALSNKDDAEQKLESIRRIIAQDVSAFQEVAGVSNVRQERTIGFLSGICASIVATGIWTWGPELWRFVRQLFG